MILFTRNLTAAFVATSLLFFNACGPKEEAPKDEEITADTLSAETREDIQLIRINIPSPMEITAELSKAGINYNKGLLNSSGKASSYTTNFKSALNLGIYGADMGYASAYNQSQDVIEYLNNIRKLAQAVGVANAFDEGILKRFETNIGNNDSLMELINIAYDKAERNLRSNQRVSTTALIIAGGWVEGLHIATQALGNVANGPKTAAVYNRVWSHVYSIKYVLELLNEFKSNADCAKALSEMKDLEAFTEQVRRSSTLSQQDIIAIRDKVTKIREGFAS